MKIAAQVDRELPGLTDRERWRVLGAEDLVRRREQARAEQARSEPPVRLPGKRPSGQEERHRPDEEAEAAHRHGSAP
ncbi:hypothetical protein [Streptomyces sp. KL2]|uniref:hypothetical protein n=1 Tax=Streptomyces sp. KL2 TaxID=3050126 RepID=UPI003978F1D8